MLQLLLPLITNSVISQSFPNQTMGLQYQGQILVSAGLTVLE